MFFVCEAQASAWNPAKGSGEIISGFIVSDAEIAVSPIGTRVPLALYEKQIVQTYGNLGLNDKWALIGSFDWQDAQIIGPDVAVGFSEPSAISAGLQYQLNRTPGKALAVSMSYYQGIDLPPSLLTLENRSDTIEIRGLWGRSRIMKGVNFFFDAQAAGRVSFSGDYSNTQLSLTLGAEPSDRMMFLAKTRYVDIEPGSFQGFAIERQRRLETEFSGIYEIRPGYHFELGYAWVSYARNAVLERGFKLGVWTQF